MKKASIFKQMTPIALAAFMGFATVSCSNGDDDDDVNPGTVTAPSFSETEVPAGGSILIETSVLNSSLTMETDGDFELEKVDGNYYLKSNSMGEASVTLTNVLGESTTETITSWGVVVDESGLDYQGIVYDNDTISDNTNQTFSNVDGDIIIPRYVVDNGVETDLTFVPASSFEGNDNLLGVSFAKESEVLSIQADAFHWNQKMKKADLSNCTALKTIGGDAFYENVEMEVVGLSNCAELETIEDGAFFACDYTKLIDLSNLTKLTYIGYDAFAVINELTTINLSNCTSLVTIAENAFRGGGFLETIDFTNCTALETIGKGSFNSGSYEIIDLTDCTKLTTIDDRTFTGTDELKSVIISSTDVSFGDDVFSDKADYTIYGVKGSATETSANAKGYPFSDIDAN